MEESSGLLKGVFVKYRLVQVDAELLAFLVDEDRFVDDQQLSLEHSFNREVAAAIDEFKGCFVKLDDTAGQVASTSQDMRNWVHDLNCTSLRDVYTIIKNSITIGDRLLQAYAPVTSRSAGKQQLTLTLRKWHDIEQSNEFRLRVVGGEIVRVYQRHPTCCFPHLSDQTHRSQVLQRVRAFFEEKVAGLLDASEFTVDVYLTASRVFLFGLRKSRADDYELAHLDREAELLTVVAEESQAVRKIWEQDMPLEFLEKAHLPGGLAEFVASMQQSTNTGKL